ncbi:MAG: hypothetical protein MR601_06115 [Erysipelotrichaceae bacterium]|nr:hypothetical protein [Erysipelotrichaceae bacterium]
MKCMFIILNNTEKLDDLLKALGDNGINGATIFESTGMAHKLLNNDDNYLRFIGSLKAILNPDRENNVTICIVLTDEQVLLARAAVHHILGDLSKPDTGILFTMPIDYIEGGSFGIYGSISK